MNTENRPAAKTQKAQAAIPWNRLMKQAKGGDETAVQTFCKQAGPILKTFCSIPFFTRKLGRDEIRSLLSLALMEFLMHYSKSLPDEEIPRLLKRILRNTLLNQIQKETTRAKYRQPVLPCHEGEERREEEPITEQYAADSTGEPENRLLQQELNQAVKDAMYYLRPSEHNVLYGLYFEYKTTAELARDMHCTTQNICRLHKNGLGHLRKLLARQLCSPLLSDLKEKLL